MLIVLQIEERILWIIYVVNCIENKVQKLLMSMTMPMPVGSRTWCVSTPLGVEILCLSADSLNGPLLVSFLFHYLRCSSWRSKPMTTKATRNTQAKTSEGPLFMAFELSEKTWKLGFTTGPGQKPRERNMTARDHERVLDEIAQAKRRLGLPETAPVVSCYEAGREGFWLHRFLEAHGLTNRGTRTIDAESPDFMCLQNQCLREIGSLLLQ
jgi:hypothetical protein